SVRLTPQERVLGPAGERQPERTDRALDQRTARLTRRDLVVDRRQADRAVQRRRIGQERPERLWRRLEPAFAFEMLCCWHGPSSARHRVVLAGDPRPGCRANHTNAAAW